MIVGLGRTGFACANFLAKQNIYADIMDNRNNPPFLSALKERLPDCNVYLEPFNSIPDDIESLIVSPGVSCKEPFIQNAIRQHKRVISDIELFVYYVNAPVIAVTGSNGKSTVTTLIGKMIEAAGLKVAVGGNLGTPAVELLSEVPPDFYVLEVSSFQLDLTYYLPVSASVVLNITQDHMDRYETMDEYVASKQQVYRNARIAIINKEDPIVLSMDTGKAKTIYFTQAEPKEGELGLRIRQGKHWLCYGSKTLMPVSELQIRGTHNQSNVLAAFALAYAIGLPIEAMLESARRFQGLPHRCQLVSESKGIKWFNDSKATNVGAAIAAINGMQERIVLIAGGDGKGADFIPLKLAIKNKVRAAVLLGRDAKEIDNLLKSVVKTVCVDTMKDAVYAASDIAKPGDSVLLAPACASLDMYKNYEARGDDFSACVKQMLSESE